MRLQAFVCGFMVHARFVPLDCTKCTQNVIL
jgi:hypothetical protein